MNDETRPWSQLPDIPVAMLCPDLSACPCYELPAGYLLRLYRPGDVDHWVSIHQQADTFNPISEALFWQKFDEDDALLAQRQYYLLAPAGEVIGTATAWNDRWRDQEMMGRIHWVAIRPAWQGRGLAKPLLSAVCQRLQIVGYRRAWLKTSLLRVPALNLYWHFGFRPDLRTSEDVEAWRMVRPWLKDDG